MARPGISTKNTEKNTPRPEILDSHNLPPKYPENTPKILPKYQKCPFWEYVFRVFWGCSLGVPEFRPGGGIFSVLLVEIPGRAISGLCSRSGRSQIQTQCRPDSDLKSSFSAEGFGWVCARGVGPGGRVPGKSLPYHPDKS